MREFHTAHLEIKKEFSEDFQTEPYECGWAREAIFFVRVEDVSGSGATLNAKAQISADGLLWADEGTTFEPITEKGLHFIRVNNFGGWLRLACSITGQAPRFRLLVNIALKE